jgi:peptidoglycan/xylan/chitin deacetylase (PgdA/CDA1 family)
MKQVTLTFDNGPTPLVTHGVLDTLARHDIRATFFVVGRKLADPAAREAVARARAEGHWIGNHSFTHGTPLGRMDDAAESVAEISRTQELLETLGVTSRLFRPFGGGGALGPHLLSRAAFDYLCNNRFNCVTWNAIPRDWEGQDWTLLVLHDLDTGAMPHLEGFLSRLRDDDVTFRQDFPPDCVVIRAGAPCPQAEGYVAGDKPEAA